MKKKGEEEDYIKQNKRDLYQEVKSSSFPSINSGKDFLGSPKYMKLPSANNTDFWSSIIEIPFVFWFDESINFDSINMANRKEEMVHPCLHTCCKVNETVRPPFPFIRAVGLSYSVWIIFSPHKIQLCTGLCTRVSNSLYQKPFGWFCFLQHVL